MLRIGAPWLQLQQPQFATCPTCNGRLSRMESFLNTQTSGPLHLDCQKPDLGRLMSDEEQPNDSVASEKPPPIEELRQMVREDIMEKRKPVEKAPP